MPKNLTNDLRAILLNIRLNLPVENLYIKYRDESRVDYDYSLGRILSSHYNCWEEDKCIGIIVRSNFGTGESKHLTIYKCNVHRVNLISKYINRFNVPTYITTAYPYEIRIIEPSEGRF